MVVGIVPMRPRFDLNSKDFKVFVNLVQFRVEIVTGFWFGLVKQLKKESDFKWLRLNKWCQNAAFGEQIRELS